MVDIVYKIEQAIKKYSLFSKGDHILIALSGGPDSMALLHLLNSLKAKYDIKLAAAHLDHTIRPTSAKDQKFCKEACRNLHIKFHSKRLDIPALAGRNKLSVEEAGRKARYDYFDSLTEKYRCDKIATGHTLDDTVETVIFNMIRGSGLSGLAGIPRKRGKIIRPLLDIEKAELLEWLKVQKIRFIQDKSNRSLDYSRNRIRLKVIPELEKINSGARQNIMRLSEIVSDEVEFNANLTVLAYKAALLESGKSKIVLDLGKLVQYDKSLIKKVIKEAFRILSGDIHSLSSQSISRALSIVNGESGRKAPLTQGICIEKSQGGIAILKPQAGKGNYRLAIPGKTEFPEGLIEAKIVKRDRIEKLDQSNLNIYLDQEKLGDITARFWQDGDKIRPLGMKGHKLLSDIFINRKIPEYEREIVPIVLSDKNIAWIPGVMISDDFRLTEQTREVLNLRYARFDN